MLAFIGWQHEHEHRPLVEIQRALNARQVEVKESRDQNRERIDLLLKLVMLGVLVTLMLLAWHVAAASSRGPGRGC